MCLCSVHACVCVCKWDPMQYWVLVQHALCVHMSHLSECILHENSRLRLSFFMQNCVSPTDGSYSCILLCGCMFRLVKISLASQGETYCNGNFTDSTFNLNSSTSILFAQRNSVLFKNCFTWYSVKTAWSIPIA